MDKRVAQLNIEHYRRLLAAEPEGPKRQTLLRLLAEEEAKSPLNALRRFARKERGIVSRRLLPFPPKRRRDVNLMVGFSVDPASEDAATRKQNSMRALIVNDGQL